MGDPHQLKFAQKHKSVLKGPVLEVGSKDYGNTQPFRELFRGEEYLGIDMQEGSGVDQVLDLTGKFEAISAAIGGRRFGTIICCSVLEHCKQPFEMAANMTKLLRPGGSAFIGVPFTIKIHGYPSDYWRFTPEGVKVLFPDLQFPDELATLSTTWPGDLRPITDRMAQVTLSVQNAIAHGDYGIVTGTVVRGLRKVGFLPGVFRFPYLHPPTDVLMIGRKALTD